MAAFAKSWRREVTKKTPPPFEPNLTAERPTGWAAQGPSLLVRNRPVPGGTFTGRTAGDHNRASHALNMGPESETGDGGRKPVRGRIANAKIFGWAIYAAGFAIWLFGYLSAGHAPLFDWKAATPWWVSSFVPTSKQNSDSRSCSRV
jgi:hypothetical protein